jgi:FkbM family methyltransferase
MEFKYDDEKSIMISPMALGDNFKGTPFSPDGKIYESESIKKFFNCIEMYWPSTDRHLNIVDVGAQIGTYSLYAKFLPSCNFFSFEPTQKSYDILNEHLAINNITNVKTFKMGISDKVGTATLNTSKNHNGLHTLGETPLRFDDVEKMTIETTTLDEMFKNIRIDLLKIDVEGWEAFVLIGGQNVIRQYKPLIQIEWCPVNMHQCKVNQTNLMNVIEQLGYRAVYLDGEEMLLHPWGRFT